MRLVALSTNDNPFNPINDFDRWFATDLQLSVLNDRRDTCSLLARFARISDEFSDSSNEKEVENAIDEIILNDPFNVYKKVVVED